MIPIDYANRQPSSLKRFMWKAEDALQSKWVWLAILGIYVALAYAGRPR